MREVAAKPDFGAGADSSGKAGEEAGLHGAALRIPRGRGTAHARGFASLVTAERWGILHGMACVTKITRERFRRSSSRGGDVGSSTPAPGTLGNGGEAPRSTETSRGGGARRSHVAGALVVAVLGGLSGPAQSPSATSAPAEAAAASPASAEVLLAGDLRSRLNPTLSPALAERIAGAVLRFSAKYRLPPDLVMAVMEVESTARLGARSPKGALGLMQVMPHMAAAVGVAGNHTTVESNIEAGCSILSHNIRRLGQDDGVSAYFWGSDIRGVSYLNRVRTARQHYRRLLEG